jgi:hypothetical protein
MRIRRLTAAFLFVSSVWSASSALAQQQGCREVPFSRKPGWTISGGWTADGSQLLVVDPLNDAVWRYSSSGASLGSLSEPLRSTVKNLMPLKGKSHGDDFILEVNDGFLTLDKSLRPVSMKDALVKSVAGPLSIGGVWQWEPVGADIVGFVDVHGDRPNSDLTDWHSAFVRFPLSNPERFNILQDVRLDSNERGLQRAGSPYIASIGTTAYVLSMDSQMTLFKNEAGSNELTPLHAFPPGPSRAPTFKPWKTKQDYVELMAAIEKISMPVGLYAQENGKYLYILWRTPLEKGTQWTLRSIDPNKDQYTGSIELPTRADHLTVVPGPENWAFIEKGPVKAYGVQDVASVLLIPSKRLQPPFRGGKACD